MGWKCHLPTWGSRAAGLQGGQSLGCDTLEMAIGCHVRVWSGVEYTRVKFKMEVQAIDQFESHRV